jgi:hypothetical protein
VAGTPVNNNIFKIQHSKNSNLEKSNIQIQFFTFFWGGGGLFASLGIGIGFNADLYPAFYLNADPDPESRTNADPEPDSDPLVRFKDTKSGIFT